MIGLILPGNIWFCPYVKIYTNILDEIGEKYEILFWNRDGSEKSNTTEISYNEPIKPNSGKVGKLFHIFRYCRFLKKQLREKSYEKLIVFGPQIGIFLSSFLKSNYPNRYIFDYRDLSIEQNVLFKRPFKTLLTYSFCNIVSSPGFIRCLPNDFGYIISHNVTFEGINNSININSIKRGLPIRILTIGAIRDYSSNAELMDAIGNDERYELHFIGKGPDAEILMKHAERKGYKNVFFKGFYHKEEEAKIIQSFDVMNIYYPKIITHSTAISNRFYNSLIYKKPIIVTNNSTQGDLAKKYGLGLSINSCENISENLIDFLTKMDVEEFNKRCEKALEDIKKDNMKLRDKVSEFCHV